MKIHTSLALALLLSASPSFIACQSSGQQSDSTAMHMDELNAAVAAAKAKINAAAESLAAVVEKGDQDPAPSFEKYKKDVAEVESAAGQSESKLKSLQEQGQAYMAEWEKQAATITDEDLKKTADERRAKLSAAVKEVADAMTAAQAEITPYRAKLKDMETYLKNDLTPAGIKSIKDKSKQISKDAKSINEKLDEVAEALTKNAPQFKTAKPPPPAEGEKKS